ncbi:MAG: hypothetical protein APR63_08455 [Desulfuromonas sp. SDB]|nr:MAG: hypothetical protein APR63_08455 [Desulfuromonas sp. SDB]
MNLIIDQMLAKYPLHGEEDYELAIKEIVQHLSLLGLWRSKFYEHAAFYGGSAARIFYGLNRFSEDLDFSLLKSKSDFKIDKYIRSIQDELNGFGFNFSIDKKKKIYKSNIESVFNKGNTVKNFIAVDVDDELVKTIHKNKKIKIKIEVDTDPPLGADYEVKTELFPIPFQVKVFSLSDLLAGKLHAILCRQWKHRVKGRDYYDLVWFVGKEVPCNIVYLKNKLVQTGNWNEQEELSGEKLLEILKDQFREIDFEKAKDDVRPFIIDQQELTLWSRDFFSEVVDKMEFV